MDHAQSRWDFDIARLTRLRGYYTQSKETGNHAFWQKQYAAHYADMLEHYGPSIMRGIPENLE